MSIHLTRVSFTQTVMFAALLLLSSTGLRTFGQAPASVESQLAFDKPFERQIKTGESHEFKVLLRQGQVLSIELEELNVTLKLELLSVSDKTELISSDVGGGFERESVTFLATQSGAYFLRVSEAENESGLGSYRLTVRLLNAVTEKEKTRIRAQQLLREAVALNKEGAPDKLREALAKREAALPLWRSVGDRYWESLTLKKLGESHNALLSYTKALDYLNQSLLISRELGDKRIEAATLSWLGIVTANTGDRQIANDYYNQAFESLKAQDSKLGMALLLTSLGDNANQLGDKPKAAEYFNQALALMVEEQNKGGHADVLYRLGTIADAQNEKPKAIELYNQALSLWRAVPNKVGEGLTLLSIGKTTFAQGDAQKAVDYYNQAFPLFKAANSRGWEAQTFDALSNAYQALGKTSESIEATLHVLSFYQEIKYRLAEVVYANAIGVKYNSIGKYEEAIKYAKISLATEETVPEGTVESKRKAYEQLMRGSKSMSFHTMGLAYHNLGDAEKALQYDTQALTLLANDTDNGSRQQAMSILTSISQTYMDSYSWDKAIENEEHALVIAREIDNKGSIASILNSLGIIHSQMGQKKTALEDYEQSLAMSRSITNRGKIERRFEAAALGNIGELYLFFGESQKALQYYQQELTVWQDINEPAFLDGQADTYRHLSDVYSYQGETGKALAALNQALDLFQRAPERIRELARNRTVEANLLNRIGVVYSNVGEHRKALEFYNRALKTAVDKKDKDLEAATLNNIAQEYGRLGEPRKALQMFLAVLEMRRAIGMKGSEGTTLNNIGAIYSDLGDKREALNYYSQSLTIAKESGNKDMEGTALSNIGGEYLGLSENDTALDYFQRALDLRRRIGDKVGEANSLGTLAGYYSRIGERAKSLNHFDQSLALCRTIGDKSGEATLLGNIAFDYLELGETTKALEYREKSLVLSRETGEKPGQINALVGLASIYRVMGEQEKSSSRFKQALDHFEQALRLTRETENKIAESGILCGIGRVYVDMNETAKALSYLTESLQLAQQYQARFQEVVIHNALGELYEKSSTPEKAVAEYQQALTVARDIADKDSEAKALKGLLTAWKARGNSEAAILYGKQAVNKYQELRSAIRTLRQETKDSYREKVADTYRILADLLIREKRLLEARRVLDLLKAEEYSQLSIGPPVSGIVPYSGAEAADLKIVDQLAVIGSEQNALNVSLREEDVTAEKRQRINERLNEIQDEFVRARKALADSKSALEEAAKSDSELRSKLDKLTTLSESNLALLGSGTVALYTMVWKESGWIILVTPDFSKAYPIDVTGLDQTIHDFQAALATDHSDPRPLAQTLYRKLLQQTSPGQVTTLEGDLNTYLANAEKKTLMWSLDGVLRYVPMAALYDGQHYLVERYRNVVFIPESILTLNDPVRPNWAALGLGVSQAIEGTVALSGAERELRAIIREQPTNGGAASSGILPGKIRLNGDFTKPVMMESLREGYAVVHIATHYTFLPNDMKRSFLLLGDGRHLTMEELQAQGGIFTRVDLLALSACDTASANVANGTEQESLAVVAQRLGAKSVIASLWPVSDLGTDELMERFYRVRQTHPEMTKGDALRQAQLALLRGGETLVGNSQSADRQRTTEAVNSAATSGAPLKCGPDAKYCHPHYWAPFILIGNWK